MSEHRRPSPIQPPFVTGVPGNMATAQRPPTLPTSNFLGRPEQRSSTGLAMPPIQTSRLAAPQMEGRTLPPIQLPPLNPPAAAATASGQSVGRVSITQLLSQSSPPRATVLPAVVQPPTLQTFTGITGISPHDARAHHQQTHRSPGIQQPYTYSVPHLTYQPVLRQPQPLNHVEQQSHTRIPSRAGSDGPQYSPAATSQSPAPSYYDSETSPCTSIAPTLQPRVSQLPPLFYNLLIRQQPVAARACGFGERDRRVIDPPPILELEITDRETGRPENDWNAMLALHCTLLSPDGKDDETEVPPAHPEVLSTRRLMGTLVASPYPAKDENGVAGTFFVFPDLSCRSPGKYRLRFKLMRIDPTMMTPGMSSPSVANITTDTFSVYTAKDFPGMRASSALLKSLRRQGLNVGVKKGSEARKGKGKAKKGNSSSDEDDDSSGSDDERRGSGETAGTGSVEGISPKTKTNKKKAKRKRADSQEQNALRTRVGGH